jgi:hypothetical protein
MENTGGNPESDEYVPQTGGCICGAVRWQISGPLSGAAFCWCKRCQRRTGTAFSTTGLTRPGTFSIIEGADLVSTYEPGDGWNKSFCSRCGSQTHTTNPENPEAIAVRIGSFDEDPGIRPVLHQFVNYAPAWYPVPDDGLPRFPERLDWSLLDG